MIRLVSVDSGERDRHDESESKKIGVMTDWYLMGISSIA